MSCWACRGAAGKTHLLEQIGGEHEDLCVGAEALDGAEVADALLVVLWRRHDLEHVERGPRHVVAQHFQVDELEEGRGLDVCRSQHGRGAKERRLTHVLAAHLGAAFLEALLDVLPLAALVGAQAPDEVVERLFEPATGQRGHRAGRECRAPYIVAGLRGRRSGDEVVACRSHHAPGRLCRRRRRRCLRRGDGVVVGYWFHHGGGRERAAPASYARCLHVDPPLDDYLPCSPTGALRA